jgi:hypothetical protein
LNHFSKNEALSTTNLRRTTTASLHGQSTFPNGDESFANIRVGTDEEIDRRPWWLHQTRRADQDIVIRLKNIKLGAANHREANGAYHTPPPWNAACES